jgi:NAD(P)-dependent dehydrogenase (short-subunit alcohol dehydrogenase family)
MQTNITGPFMLTRALLGQMLARGTGSTIIHTDAGVVGYPTWAHTVFKGCTGSPTRTWAAELDGTGAHQQR